MQRLCLPCFAASAIPLAAERFEVAPVKRVIPAGSGWDAGLSMEDIVLFGSNAWTAAGEGGRGHIGDRERGQARAELA